MGGWKLFKRIIPNSSIPSCALLTEQIQDVPKVFKWDYGYIVMCEISLSLNCIKIKLSTDTTSRT